MSLALTAAQTDQFHQDGYLIFRGMVAPGMCAQMQALAQRHLQDEVAPLEYEADVGYDGAPDSLEALGGHTVRRLRGAFARDPLLRNWALDPLIGERLRLLLEEPVILTLAHHNSVMTKHRDFGSATGWHRDSRYWSFARTELISVWLALGNESASNGGLRVIPGSHHWQLAPGQLDALDFLRPDVAQNQSLFAQGIDVELAAGDVLFFHSGLFHAAGRNEGAHIKTSVVFAYRAQSNPPRPGSNSAAASEVPLVTP
jgi:phytanoyl-CoA hydroxylase